MSRKIWTDLPVRRRCPACGKTMRDMGWGKRADGSSVRIFLCTDRVNCRMRDEVSRDPIDEPEVLSEDEERYLLRKGVFDRIVSLSVIL